MDESALQQLLNDVQSGACTPDEAVARLRRLPFADLGFARSIITGGCAKGFPRPSTGRARRPSSAQPSWASCWVMTTVATRESRARVAHPWSSTRADVRQLALVMSDHPGGEVTNTGPATSADRQRGELSTVVWRPSARRPSRVLVVTAGTSDLPVARECTATLRALGLDPLLIADCGVAGVHRLLASFDELADADAVVVVAGMEGALASLVGGVTPAPVVAVPTSTGYGSGLEGVTALLAMTASCAAGVTVVGIDNGFGAACAVARMLP